MQEIQSINISSAEKSGHPSSGAQFSCCDKKASKCGDFVIFWLYFFKTIYCRTILSVSSLFRLLFIWKNQLDSSDFRVHNLLLHRCFPNMTCTNLMPKSASSINDLLLNFVNCQAGAFQKNIRQNMSWKGFSLSLQVFDLWLCLCQLEQHPWATS